MKLCYIIERWLFEYYFVCFIIIIIIIILNYFSRYPFNFLSVWRHVFFERLTSNALWSIKFVIHSFIHSFTHSLIHSFIHSLTHSFIHSLSHSFKLAKKKEINGGCIFAVLKALALENSIFSASSSFDNFYRG